MTGGVSEFPVLLFHQGPRCLAVLSSQVHKIDHETSLQVGPTLSIAMLYGEVDPPELVGERRILRTEVESSLPGILIPGAIELRSLPETAFMALPMLLQSSGVPPWLRGLVLTEGEGEDDRGGIAVWIDLPKLVSTFGETVQ